MTAWTSKNPISLSHFTSSIVRQHLAITNSLIYHRCCKLNCQWSKLIAGYKQPSMVFETILQYFTSQLFPVKNQKHQATCSRPNKTCEYSWKSFLQQISQLVLLICSRGVSVTLYRVTWDGLQCLDLAIKYKPQQQAVFIPTLLLSTANEENPVYTKEQNLHLYKG